MQEPQMCNVVCCITLDAKLANELKEKIDDEYRVNMVLDKFSLVVPYKRPDTDSLVYQRSVPVVVKAQYAGSKEEKYFIYNHLTFAVTFHKDKDIDAARIVGLEVKPFSSDSHSPQEVEDKKEIIFAYDVEFKESEVKWASRWDTYLLMADDQIHYF